MNGLDEILSNLTLSGPYATGKPAAVLAALASARGYGVYAVDLAGIADEAALMARLQDALGFPEWFGRNWDALEDCLTDMSWSDHIGYVLLIRGGVQLRREQQPLLDTLIDVLKCAADFWRVQERPFWAVFLDLPPGPSLPALPSIPPSFDP
jgi:RNAse (barnase) inhibitor barstar